MHPIVSEQIASSRMRQLHREAAAARRVHRNLRRPTGAWRVALASIALSLARALDRDGRVVPAAARAVNL